MTFQPAAGAHGEFTGAAAHQGRTTMRGATRSARRSSCPTRAHGTNPATRRHVRLRGGEHPLRRRTAAWIWTPCGPRWAPDTAGLMLTNPNTVGMFDKNILEITRIVHEAGGLCYYDGANLNAVMGIVRPGDMGFDVRPPEPAQDLRHAPRRRRPRRGRGGLQGVSGATSCPAAQCAEGPRLRPGALHRPGTQLLRQLPGGGAGAGLPADTGQARESPRRPSNAVLNANYLHGKAAGDATTMAYDRALYARVRA